MVEQEQGLRKDPKGEISLDIFTIDALKFLQEHKPDMAQKARTLCLQNTMKNYKETGKDFIDFDLQREIIEYANSLKS